MADVLFFFGRQYATLEIRGAVLGRHVGHDSCCCSAVSEPANGLSKLVSAMGRCGTRFVFFRASVRNVRDSGRCAGKACWARILLLFGCFGTSQCQWTSMDSQSWFLQWVGVAEALFFLGRQYATLEIRGAVLGRHVGHDSCCCSAVSEPANGLLKLVWTLKAGFCNG